MLGSLLHIKKYIAIIKRVTNRIPNNKKIVIPIIKMINKGFTISILLTSAMLYPNTTRNIKLKSVVSKSP